MFNFFLRTVLNVLVLIVVHLPYENVGASLFGRTFLTRCMKIYTKYVQTEKNSIKL